MATIDDTSMPQWYIDGMAAMAAREAAEKAPAAPAAPAAPSADDIREAARHLVDLGISPAMAAIMANPEKREAMERQQRRRDAAARLGVDARYLPEGFEDGN